MKELFGIGTVLLKELSKWVVLIVILIALVFGVVYGVKHVKELRDTIDRQDKNILFYKGQLSNLRVTKGELEAANDSLSLYIKKVLRDNKIKVDDVQSINVTELTLTTEIIDTVLVQEDCSFKDTTYFNPYTTLLLESTRNMWTNELLINKSLQVRDSLAIVNYIKFIYKNDYKNKWVRFWHFDWKKTPMSNVLIDNRNKLIKFSEPKVITIVEE